MDASDIVRLTTGRPDRRVADGEVVLRRGVRSGGLVVLVDGTLEVRRNDHAVVRMSEPGSIVGELGLLLDAPASADVVAVGPALVRRIDDAAELFDSSPEFARHLATVLARRLWQVSTYLSDLQQQFAGSGDVLGLVPTVLQDLLGGARPVPDPGSDREPDAPY